MHKLGSLPRLTEPNDELQIDFAGLITDNLRINTNHHILVSVDRYSRYPAALVHANCDNQTAIDFLNQYCAFHGIYRSI